MRLPVDAQNTVVGSPTVHTHTDSHHQPAPTGVDVGELLVDYIATVIALNDDDDRGRDEEIDALEAQGRRIVTGGQTGSYEKDGDREVTTFEMRDWRTNKVIFENRGTIDDFDRLCRQHDPETRWYHVDLIGTTSDLPPAPHGLPGSLAQRLGDWATDHADEARDLVAGTRERTPITDEGSPKSTPCATDVTSS